MEVWGRRQTEIPFHAFASFLPVCLFGERSTGKGIYPTYRESTIFLLLERWEWGEGYGVSHSPCNPEAKILPTKQETKMPSEEPSSFCKSEMLESVTY